MKTAYRKDYPGEFIILNTRIVNGVKEQKREWVENPIENQHISDRALVVGSNYDLVTFDYTRLENHKGGLQGRKRLQTYGTEKSWRGMRLDFYVSTDEEELTDINESNYFETTSVYSSTRLVLLNPGKYFLIPHSVSMYDPALAIYLAAFDGHNEVFLIGYGNDTPFVGVNWINQVRDVMASYATTQFILVGPEGTIPDACRNLQNVRTMEYRYFISYCDV